MSKNPGSNLLSVPTETGVEIDDLCRESAVLGIASLLDESTDTESVRAGSAASVGSA